MSIWTHVNGNIRVDGIKGLMPNPDFEDILGRIVDYDSENYETKLPCGSEGSLEYNIWENPNESCMARWSISIFGDLRDYEDNTYIENWFKKVCSSLFIRQAVLNIDGYKPFALVYSGEEVKRINV